MPNQRGLNDKNVYFWYPNFLRREVIIFSTTPGHKIYIIMFHIRYITCPNIQLQNFFMESQNLEKLLHKPVISNTPYMGVFMIGDKNENAHVDSWALEETLAFENDWNVNFWQLTPLPTTTQPFWRPKYNTFRINHLVN